MSDIDILVRPADVAATEALLRAEGFACERVAALESSWRHRTARRRPVSLEMVDADEPWTIDLHRSLDLMIAAAAPMAHLDRARPIEFSETWKPGCPGLRLRQPLLLLHLAVHAGSGSHNLSLLRLLEICLVIRRESEGGALDWEEFLDVAAHTGCQGYAMPALALSERLMPGLVPDFVLSACAHDAPRRAVAFVAGQEPATVQRVDRHSLREHFMWTRGLGGWLRQIAADLSLQAAGTIRDTVRTQVRRGWIILRGNLSR